MKVGKHILAVGLVLLSGCGATSEEPAAAKEPLPVIPAHAVPEAVPAQRGKPPIQAGSLVIEPGGYDLGSVKPNTAHEFSLTLRNVSGEPIVIQEVTSDCKCTVP